MSELDDILADCHWPALLEQRGEAAVHIAPDGTETAVTAMIDGDQIEQEDTPDGSTKALVRQCRFTSDPTNIYGGVATVEPGDQVTAGGYTYVVRMAAGPVGGMWFLTLARRLLAEAARPGIRDVTGYRRRQ